MDLWMLILFAVVVVVSFTVGFYFAQKRFWVQDRNSSRTAPPSPPEGTGNELNDDSPVWRPPKAS